MKGEGNIAIYHCSIKVISRGKGKSAVASSAYRSGERMENEYDGVVHDFTKKGGIVHTEILLPAYAPSEFANRSVLWNSVEKIEKAKNSQLAREIELALPIELNRKQQIALVREYVQQNFVSVGMCADIAIHDKEDGNPHAHIMLTMRPLEQNGEWGAKSRKEYILDKNGQRIKLKNGTFKSRKVNTVDWNNQENAERWRQAWAELTNHYLEKQNVLERVDHRSYQRQGIDLIPTIHMRVSATQMERKGIITEKGNRNREIREQNRLLKEVSQRIRVLSTWLKEKKKQKEDTLFINPIHPSHPSEVLPTLLEQMSEGLGESSVSQSRYGKVRDLKTYAKAVGFLQEKNITTLVELQEVVSDMKKRYWNVNKQIKQTERLLHEERELIEQSEKYLKYRPIYKAYTKMKTKKQDAYYNQHTTEIILYRSAEQYLKEHLKGG